MQLTLTYAGPMPEGDRADLEIVHKVNVMKETNKEAILTEVLLFLRQLSIGLDDIKQHKGV
jgi:hypothetical protein